MSYETSDIHLASALMSAGHRLDSVKSDSGRGFGKAIFILSGEDINEDAFRYMNDELELPPRKLFTRLRELKAMAANTTRRR